MPVVAGYKDRQVRLYFRGDAAFASPDLYEYLEAEGILYAIRLSANKAPQESIAHLLGRPVGRPPKYVQRFGSSFMSWPIISPTSCGRWRCPGRSSTGR